MSFKDILAVVMSPETDAHVLACSERLAARTGANITAALISYRPTVPAFVEGGVADGGWDESVKSAREALETQRQAVAARLHRAAGCSAAVGYLVGPEDSGRAIARHARHADLAIISRQADSMTGEGHAALIEGVLFGSGRPVLVVPPSPAPATIGRTILICWNGSRESARAVADAMPLIEASHAVHVLEIDRKAPDLKHAELPSVDISTHLLRHGVRVVPHQVEALARIEADVAVQTATDVGADLIVMGAYGRPRLSEIVFGGMTRDMLASASFPLLMSH
jgi:nucleotide-binding universal stress UspA family protein